MVVVKKFRTGACLVVAAGLMTLGACANKEAIQMQVDSANTALQGAEQANAAQFAPGEYNKASSTVQAANQAVQDRKWKDAGKLAEQGAAEAALSQYMAEKNRAQQRLDEVSLLPIGR